MSKTQYNSSISRLTGMTGQTMLHMAMIRAVNERVKSDELKNLYESVVSNNLNVEEVYPKLDVYCAKVKSVCKDILEEYIVAGYGTVQIKKDGAVCQLNHRHFAKNLHNRISQVKPIFEANSLWYCNCKEVLESLWYTGATMLEIVDERLLSSDNPADSSAHIAVLTQQQEKVDPRANLGKSNTFDYFLGVKPDGIIITKRNNFSTFSLLRTVTLLGCNEERLFNPVSYKF